MGVGSRICRRDVVVVVRSATGEWIVSRSSSWASLFVVVVDDDDNDDDENENDRRDERVRFM
jgi:hypothetical protein